MTGCPSNRKANFTHIIWNDIRHTTGCYKLVDQNMEWLVAGLYCRSLHKDAHLLVINNAIEQAMVQHFLSGTDRQFIVHVFLYCLNVEF